MAEERLQKILARAGYGSRRAAEELIETGRVTVNGTLAQLGDKADASRDAIKVDGRRMTAAAASVYYAVYKPRGVLSTTGGPEPRQKVVDLIPGAGQLHLVGRLDKESEGLMLLTNDGALTQRVSHPRYEQEKEYRVLVARKPDEEQLATWRRGVVLEDGTRTRPAEVRIEHMYGKGAWLRVIMHEGHKRQIREIAGKLGLPVAKLIRVRIANLYLGNLKPGEWRELNEAEVRDLLAGEKPASRKPRPAKAATSKVDKPKTRKPGAAGKGPGSRKPAARKPGITLGRPRRSSPSEGSDAGKLASKTGRRPSKPASKRPSGRSDARPGSTPASKRPSSRSGARPGSTPASKRPGGRSGARPDSRPASKRPSSRSGARPGSKPGGAARGKTRGGPSTRSR